MVLWGIVMFYNGERGIIVHKFGLCWKTSSKKEFTERITLLISYNCLKFSFYIKWMPVLHLNPDTYGFHRTNPRLSKSEPLRTQTGLA